MEIRRTVPVKLDVADSDADLLHETICLNRGTLNVNGEYSSASDGQNGSPRESPTLNEASDEAVSE